MFSFVIVVVVLMPFQSTEETVSELADRTGAGHSNCLDEVRTTPCFLPVSVTCQLLALLNVPGPLDLHTLMFLINPFAFIWLLRPSDSIVNILYIIVSATPLRSPTSISFTDNRFFGEYGKLWLRDTICGAKHLFDCT